MRLSVLFAFTTAMCAQDRGAIEGYVHNTAAGAGLSGVRVSVEPVSGIPQLHVYTDDGGAYRIDDLQEGDYRIAFEKNGFVGPRGEPREAVVHVASDGTSHFNGALAPWPKLHGQVRDPEGKPVAGAHVRISPALDGDTTTGDEGTFGFDDLKPGVYVLSASVPGQAATYFPSTNEPAQTREIQLEGGDDLWGIEIQLRSAPVYRVRGVVLDSSDNPVAHAKVTLFQPSASRPIIGMGAGPAIPLPIEQQQTESSDSGMFEFSAAAGDWALGAQLTEYSEAGQHNVTHRGRTVPLRIAREDAEGAEVRIEETFAVTTSFELDDAAKASSARRPLGGVGLLGVHDGHGGISFLEAGPKKISPGTYLVTPREAPGFYTAAVLLGGRDVLGQEVTLTGPADLRVVYRSDGGGVRGSAKVGDGGAAVLCPQSAVGAADIEYVRRIRRDGTFVLNDLPPGDYFAGAFDGADVVNPRSLAALRTEGVSVHVEPRSVTTVDLKVIH